MKTILKFLLTYVITTFVFVTIYFIASLTIVNIEGDDALDFIYSFNSEQMKGFLIFTCLISIIIFNHLKKEEKK